MIYFLWKDFGFFWVVTKFLNSTVSAWECFSMNQTCDFRMFVSIKGQKKYIYIYIYQLPKSLKMSGIKSSLSSSFANDFFTSFTLISWCRGTSHQSSGTCTTLVFRMSLDPDWAEKWCKQTNTDKLLPFGTSQLAKWGGTLPAWWNHTVDGRNTAKQLRLAVEVGPVSNFFQGFIHPWLAWFLPPTVLHLESVICWYLCIFLSELAESAIDKDWSTRRAMSSHIVFPALPCQQCLVVLFLP